jgi:hypothetical protein
MNTIIKPKKPQINKYNDLKINLIAGFPEIYAAGRQKATNQG